MKEFKKCPIISILIIESNEEEQSIKKIKNIGKKLIETFIENELENYPTHLFFEDGIELLTGLEIFETYKKGNKSSNFFATSHARTASFSDLQDIYGNYCEEELQKIRMIITNVYNKANNKEKKIEQVSEKEKCGKQLYNEMIRIREQ